MMMSKSKFVAVFVGLMCAWTLVPDMLAQETTQNQSPQAVDTDLDAQLILAAKSGSSNEIRRLLKAGATVNTRNEDGLTVLMVAAATNTNSEVVTALLKAGAEVDARHEGGFTALILAAANNTNPEVITALLKARADAKLKDDSGKIALDYAKENKNLKGTDAYWKLVDASY